MHHLVLSEKKAVIKSAQVAKGVKILSKQWPSLADFGPILYSYKMLSKDREGPGMLERIVFISVASNGKS